MAAPCSSEVGETLAVNRVHLLDDAFIGNAGLPPKREPAVDDAAILAWVIAKRSIADEEYQELNERRRCDRHRPHSDGALTARWRRV